MRPSPPTSFFPSCPRWPPARARTSAEIYAAPKPFNPHQFGILGLLSLSLSPSLAFRSQSAWFISRFVRPCKKVVPRRERNRRRVRVCTLASRLRSLTQCSSRTSRVRRRNYDIQDSSSLVPSLPPSLRPSSVPSVHLA